MFHRDPNPAVTRRQLLSRLGSGFGTLSLAGLLADEGMLCANETADQTGKPVRGSGQKHSERRNHAHDDDGDNHPAELRGFQQVSVPSLFLECFQRNEKPGELLIVVVRLR